MNKKSLNPTSDKGFGYFFSSIFAIAAIYYAFIHSSYFVSIVLLVVTCMSLLATFYKPNLFSQLNAIWFLFAIMLGRIFNPIVLGSVYFLVLTPIALITKLFGRDELLLKRTGQQTYWLVKDKDLKNSQSYKDQY